MKKVLCYKAAFDLQRILYDVTFLCFGMILSFKCISKAVREIEYICIEIIKYPRSGLNESQSIFESF